MSDVNTVAVESSAPAPVQYDNWDEKGNPIVTAKPLPAESAPAKKTSSDAEGTEDVKEAKSSDAKPKAEKPAPASETGEETQELGKGAQARKAELNREIRELIAHRDQIKAEIQGGKKSDVKAESSPAKPPELKAPVKPEENDPKFKTWDEYQAARDQYYEDMADYKAKKAVLEDRIARQQEAALKDMQEKLSDVQKRYPDFSEKTMETAKQLTESGNVVAALVNDSEIFGDLLYVLSGDKAQLDELMSLAKTNPGKAIRKVVLLEKLTQDELSKSKSESVKTEAPAKAKPQAPEPPKEVGGRGTPAEDSAVAAARSGDYRSFEAEMNRRAFTPRT